MDEKILKFKEGISTSLFDNGSGEEVYLINYHNRNWKVSKLIYYVYRGIDGKRSIVEIKDFLLEKYSLNIDTNNINKIIQVAFIKNGLIEGTESITEAKKNKMLWGKITLLKSDVVSRFK